MIVWVNGDTEIMDFQELHTFKSENFIIGQDNFFKFLRMCTPRTYYINHLNRSIVLLHKLLLVKIYLAAVVIGMKPVQLKKMFIAISSLRLLPN